MYDIDRALRRLELAQRIEEMQRQKAATADQGLPVDDITDGETGQGRSGAPGPGTVPASGRRARVPQPTQTLTPPAGTARPDEVGPGSPPDAAPRQNGYAAEPLPGPREGEPADGIPLVHEPPPAYEPPSAYAPPAVPEGHVGVEQHGTVIPELLPEAGPEEGVEPDESWSEQDLRAAAEAHERSLRAAQELRSVTPMPLASWATPPHSGTEGDGVPPARATISRSRTVAAAGSGQDAGAPTPSDAAVSDADGADGEDHGSTASILANLIRRGDHSPLS